MSIIEPNVPIATRLIGNMIVVIYVTTNDRKYVTKNDAMYQIPNDIIADKQPFRILSSPIS